MIRRLCLLLAVVGLSGCGIIMDALDTVDTKADMDWSIEEDLAEFTQKPAIESLQAGAVHINSAADKDVLLPLCQRLEAECKVKTIAVLDEEEDEEGKSQTYIYEVVVQLPTDMAAQASVLTAIREADAKFAGEIEISQGEKWLAFLLLGPDDID